MNLSFEIFIIFPRVNDVNYLDINSQVIPRVWCTSYLNWFWAFSFPEGRTSTAWLHQGSSHCILYNGSTCLGSMALILDHGAPWNHEPGPSIKGIQRTVPCRSMGGPKSVKSSLWLPSVSRLAFWIYGCKGRHQKEPESRRKWPKAEGEVGWSSNKALKKAKEISRGWQSSY